MYDEDSASCLARWSSRGPRYTSYPPATEFAPISPARVRSELAAIGEANESVSLYLHIPFCRTLCWYCGCNVIATRDETRGITYVDQLVTEMTLVAGHLLAAPVTEIALGGGSPNFLPARTLREVFAALERYFAIQPDARRSIELDPRTTSAPQIDTLAMCGFRSLSMGVQDFDDRVQDAINRHQSVAQTRWLVERARAAGFDDINVDIVYGLPLQTEETFARTVDETIALAPDRVALFGYAHLPSKLPHQRLVERAGRVLDPYERATLLLLAIERFAKAGYVHLGLDHFARPGSKLARAAEDRRMTRSFQGYVERRADNVIGLGVSAISSTPRLHWQNHGELRAWEHDIAARRLPVERGFVLDQDDRARRALIGELMCEGEADLARLGEQFRFDAEGYFARELTALDQLADLASYDRTTKTIRTTKLGRLLVRNVCVVFDRYFRQTPGEARFSSTV
ncbi:MAG: oxygen-independent coproporphyrinogen III oxidase [Kofleriaceae bacterium]|nr:oxygen-independent coproporphyrinogen III oxidase [Kofleriaceae bacterium]